MRYPLPQSFGIFDRPDRPLEAFPARENDLPFRNAAYVFEDSRYPLTHGYCWGHTTTHQQLFRLSFFEPDSTPPYEEGTEEWARYYREILRDITSRNRPRDIPGFSSIHEFTSHPTIQEYLLNDVIPHSWASRAMSFESVKTIVSGSNSMTQAQSANLISNVRERIEKFNVNPTLLFKSKSNNQSVHIVAVHDVRQEEGQTIFCLTDSNSSSYINSMCLTQMIIAEDGKVTYTGWPDDEAISITVPPHDDSDMVAQARNLRLYCESKRDNCPL